MNRKPVRYLWMLVALVLILSVAIACRPRVTQASFDKVKIGMSEDEVKKILGPPTETSSIAIGGFSGAALTWTGKEGTIAIQFLNGKAQAKEFFKPSEERPQK
ncbi:MAG: outer membrane protein assembly factor BamE [Candidatus Lindowbacteria bacterium]|nr:outer membrane protein assembly factor BamE [Candidatus Lindowbacteria bacterium]